MQAAPEVQIEPGAVQAAPEAVPAKAEAQPHQQAPFAASNYAEQFEQSKGQGTSGLAIAALVFGVAAISTSFLPIINNASFFIALAGVIFAIAGIVATRKGKGKKGRGIAIASLIISAVAIVIVVATQAFFVSLFNTALNGAKPVSTTAQSAQSQKAVQSEYDSLNVGQSVTLSNGMTVTVNGVREGLRNYDGSHVTEVAVTYSNGGRHNEDFNLFDWKAEDANGVISGMTYYQDAKNELSSGQLAPGGVVTGNIYFEGDAVKVHYYDNALTQSQSSVSWLVG